MKFGSYVPILLLPLIGALTLFASAEPSNPRITRFEGFTRVVLESRQAPKIAAVNVESRSLSVQISGASFADAGGVADTEELISWKLGNQGENERLEFKTAFPLSSDHGFKVFTLPPSEGLGHRVVVDLGPNVSAREPEVQPAPTAPDSSATVTRAANVPNPFASGPAKPAKPSSKPTVVPAAANRPTKRPAPTVVIDPGHGGMDPGMMGYVVEKSVTLDISLKLKLLLEDAGIRVRLTRAGDYAWQGRTCDKRCDLDKRADMASTDRNLFVSIHVNSGGGHGIETYVFGEPLEASALAQAERENGGGSLGKALTRQARVAAKELISNQLAKENLEFSQQLASSVQRSLIAFTGAPNKGIKRNSLWVIRFARIPAILVETGFGDHPTEGRNLATNAYRLQLAQGMAKGIRAFLHW